MLLPLINEHTGFHYFLTQVIINGKIVPLIKHHRMTSD